MKPIIDEVTVHSDGELMLYMNKLANELDMLDGDVKCNIDIEFRDSDMPNAENFLEGWRQVFEITGATMTWRKSGFWKWRIYKVRVEGTEPITARNFVQSQLMMNNDN
jgi:hypothetical protein